ncbi:unnamed protein product [Linum trigynum]|uniref:Uncharacterized protein n=1 Tax=Linum trigynum TaxID=586398 RepID=A0AAV2FV39_9ROSI
MSRRTSHTKTTTLFMDILLLHDLLVVCLTSLLLFPMFLAWQTIMHVRCMHPMQRIIVIDVFREVLVGTHVHRTWYPIATIIIHASLVRQAILHKMTVT